jgi:hypothetical protein
MPVSPERLFDFTTSVYARVAIPETDARLAADTLVQADLWGHQSRRPIGDLKNLAGEPGLEADFLG